MSESGSNVENQIIIFAVIQEQDSEIARNALEKKGVCVGKLPSVGGFLGKRNVTLMIGIYEKEWNQIEEILREVCSQRVEYIQMPLVSAPIPLPSPVPVTVGGAVLLGLDVEHYEVF